MKFCDKLLVRSSWCAYVNFQEKILTLLIRLPGFIQKQNPSVIFKHYFQLYFPNHNQFMRNFNKGYFQLGQFIFMSVEYFADN